MKNAHFHMQLIKHPGFTVAKRNLISVMSVDFCIAIGELFPSHLVARIRMLSYPSLIQCIQCLQLND